ncbi:L-rhamnose mutarotase [Haladaptatus pallidirubidus]|uniref:L-rhamnose mutarotase n=1 Tax=Haladaptatus pallidirubidus TaxID=1008152 RepID=UPI002239183A|nr:L-rhamnose mutarotase [Haladaptatus pallidirubidus]
MDSSHVEAYTEAHNNVPTDVTNAMERGGFRNFELYIRGTVAVCLLEVDDIDHYLDVVTDDPAIER